MYPFNLISNAILWTLAVYIGTVGTGVLVFCFFLAIISGCQRLKVNKSVLKPINDSDVVLYSH